LHNRIRILAGAERTFASATSLVIDHAVADECFSRIAIVRAGACGPLRCLCTVTESSPAIQASAAVRRPSIRRTHES
jgi:hypothetical protein